MADPESTILDEHDNSVDIAATNLCATSLGEIPVTQSEPQAQTLPPLESTKKKKRVRSDKDFSRDRARSKHRTKILGVRDFFGFSSRGSRLFF